jgi:hypothetical protein
MADKHKYCNEILFTAKSGETGEPLQEIIFRQYYASKAEQVAEQSQLIPACFAAINEVSMSSALANVEGLSEAQSKRGRGSR